MRWPDDFIDRIICGDCLEFMKDMPDESINMCMTSPPYWGLRDYGIDGQYGLEETPEEYIEKMTAVFSEVKRTMRRDGTLWLNIGDTYSSGTKGDNRTREEKLKASGLNRHHDPNKVQSQFDAIGTRKVNIGLPSKCLCMIPERLAWSLIQDGWILRNKNVWYKPNAMPSSVKDRFSNKWEYVFMFSKSQKYYFDLDAVREPHSLYTHPYGKNGSFEIHADKKTAPTWGMAGSQSLRGKQYHKYRLPEGKNPGDVFFIKERKKSARKYENIPGQEPHSIARHSGYYDENGKCLVDFEKGKNPGDLFVINTQPFPEAHFAVFPEKLCEKPIKAGSREGDIILDPFCGAGTVLYVAKEMGRKYIGIDIKQEFCGMSKKRIAQGIL